LGLWIHIGCTNARNLTDGELSLDFLAT